MTKLTHPLTDRDAPTPAAITAPDGQTYTVADDDTVDVPDDVAADLRDAWTDRYGVEAVTPDGPSGTLPFNPESQTVPEIEERIVDMDDPEALRALRDLEREQEDRTTAVDAIEERLDDITEE